MIYATIQEVELAIQDGLNKKPSVGHYDLIKDILSSSDIYEAGEADIHEKIAFNSVALRGIDSIYDHLSKVNLEGSDHGG